MSVATSEKVWTAEDLLAMPDDGVERWIIRGQLREKPPEFPEAKMTVRNRHHCELTVNVGTTIKSWLKAQPKPRGAVYAGELGVLLPGSSSTVGVDVAYAAADVVSVQDDDKTTLLEGVPTLTVEIMSPNDTAQQVNEKTREYLRAGVAIVWVVEPDNKLVKVFHPGVPATAYSITQRIPEHPAMPGFSPTVAELFE